MITYVTYSIVDHLENTEKHKGKKLCMSLAFREK